MERWEGDDEVGVGRSFKEKVGRISANRGGANAPVGFSVGHAGVTDSWSQ